MHTACTSLDTIATAASASVPSSSTVPDDDASRCALLALSLDELGVIVDGVADPLYPKPAVSLSGTCKGLRTQLRVFTLPVLKHRHEQAEALCLKMGYVSPHDGRRSLRYAERVRWTDRDLKATDMATLGMILRTARWPSLCRLSQLELGYNFVGDSGVQALCEGLTGAFRAPLRILGLGGMEFGLAGAEGLAAALNRGALPKLEELYLHDNRFGNQGVAVLAAPLRKLPALKRLSLSHCGIDDEGVASLVAGLGKDDFKALEHLSRVGTDPSLTKEGCDRLVAAVDAGAFPALQMLQIEVVTDEFDVTAPVSVHKQGEVAILAALARRKGGGGRNGHVCFDC